jgi:hypothetical protein
MASARSGLGPFAVLAVVLAAAYAGWCVLGARDPGDPFGAWSDAAQVAPGPPALPEPAGEVLPASAAADEDDDDQDSR